MDFVLEYYVGFLIVISLIFIVLVLMYGRYIKNLLSEKGHWFTGTISKIDKNHYGLLYSIKYIDNDVEKVILTNQFGKLQLKVGDKVEFCTLKKEDYFLFLNKGFLNMFKNDIHVISSKI